MKDLTFRKVWYDPETWQRNCTSALHRAVVRVDMAATKGEYELLAGSRGFKR